MNIYIDCKVAKMIDDFINDPIRKHGTGDGSSTVKIETRILPDGRILEVQLVITTYRNDLITFMESDE